MSAADISKEADELIDELTRTRCRTVASPRTVSVDFGRLLTQSNSRDDFQMRSIALMALRKADPKFTLSVKFREVLGRRGDEYCFDIVVYRNQDRIMVIAVIFAQLEGSIETEVKKLSAESAARFIRVPSLKVMVCESGGALASDKKIQTMVAENLNTCFSDAKTII